MKALAFYVALFVLVLLATIAFAPVAVEKSAPIRDHTMQIPWQDFDGFIEV